MELYRSTCHETKIDSFTLFLLQPPPPLLFLCVLFSNHIIFILKVYVGSTDHP
jgi:hypothetical protein